MNRWFACMSNTTVAALIAVGNVAAAVLFAILVPVGLCLYGGGGAACFAGYAVAIAALAAAVGASALAIIIAIAVGCFVSARGSSAGTAALAGATPVGVAIREPSPPMDCKRAQQLLAQAQTILDAAASAQTARQALADQARSSLNQALAAEAGAIGALAVSAFQPWLLPGALAALAAATALVAVRASARRDAEIALAEANARLLRAIADKAAAEALVLALCGPDAMTTTPGLVDGSFGVGATLVTP